MGQHNAVTQKKLATAVGVNRSTLRSELRRLREERQIPIANQRDGYYIIQSKQELQDYIGHINQEIESKKKTIEHTIEAYEDFDGEIPEESTQDVQEQTYNCNKCGNETSKADCYWPKDGEHAGTGPYCKGCFGNLIMAGEA